MGRPLLLDPPLPSTQAPPLSPPPRSDPPAQGPSSPTSSDSDSTVFPASPFYGLAPEVVALLRQPGQVTETRTTDNPAARALDAQIGRALRTSEPRVTDELWRFRDDAVPCPPPSTLGTIRPLPTDRPTPPRARGLTATPYLATRTAPVGRGSGMEVSAGQNTDFAARLQTLAQTLESLAERAGSLNPRPQPVSLLLTSGASLETATLARHTDGIRHTVRQLLLASQRVSDAVERHRQRQLVLDPTQPLPVILPDRSLSPSPRRPASTATLDQLRPPFTSSPLPLSRTSATPVPPTEAENYPGEHAQLLRINQLQADIASRANELRHLRERSLELERAQRAIARRDVEVSELGDVDVDCEVEIGADRRGAGPFQPFAARRPGLGGECIRLDKREDPERVRKEYEEWSFCGR
ncbi:hypothetical protein Rt10032_c18g5987 [Rhodotorula toruloides]|uniref:Uncharacterized protein n=1 Tax=Rhodotorula toruloides TaxID=5286 RepID=A0A511KNL7_RHOTO|nr:hypothetical protein Rt10032_c18g5987 [Rhodotorula toruloides]